MVTTANSTLRSDLRIFQSDNDVTVTAMSQSQAAFEQACLGVFAKMINTVPSNVELSAPIGPRPFITMFSFVDLSSAGVITYNGQVGTYSKTGSPTVASYVYGMTGSGTVQTTPTKTTQPGGEFCV